MIQIVVNQISGGTYPISVYISDINGGNETLLGIIEDGPVPPVVEYDTVIPPIFQTAPQILLKMVDNNNCEVFKVLDCVLGDFLITQDGFILITQDGNFLFA